MVNDAKKYESSYYLIEDFDKAVEMLEEICKEKALGLQPREISKWWKMSERRN